MPQWWRNEVFDILTPLQFPSLEAKESLVLLRTLQVSRKPVDNKGFAVVRHEQSEQGGCPHPQKGKGQCSEPSLVCEAIRSVWKSLGSSDRRELVLEELKGGSAFQASVMTALEGVRDLRGYD